MRAAAPARALFLRGYSSAGVVLVLLMSGGCVGGPDARWGQHVHWPAAADLREAAGAAALDPQTWLPLAGAALLTITDRDNAWSESLADDQPLFGDDAADVSDDLRDLTTVAYFVTALAAPSPDASAKLRGLSVGVGTMLLEGAVTTALKEVTSRERPNGRNDRSLPSGHAAQAASRAALTIGNLQYFDMPRWGRIAATTGLYTVAGGAAWARVEARKHHLSDVLAGYALGHFLAAFTQQAFMRAGAESGLSLQFVPVERGGALRLTTRF